MRKEVCVGVGCGNEAEFFNEKTGKCYCRSCFNAYMIRNRKYY